jgi:NADH-quinone oxidoreductase subunit G
VRICEEVQGVGVLSFIHRGSHLKVGCAFDKPLGETDCVGCGQCTTVCPTGSLTVKNDTVKVWNALANSNIRVVAQIAPAVRIALGEEFGMEDGSIVIGKTVTALKKLGFDEVYDTNLGADFTIMEESRELNNKIKEDKELPLFTSCCPAWVRFCETRYPEYVPHLSTAKSPMQMLAAVVKEQFRKMKEVDGKDTFMVGIMPCTAKKEEAARPEFSFEGNPDVDVIITTQELAIMIKEAGIKFEEIESQAPDMPFGFSSGAGALFGVTGGVTEAALRNVISRRGADSLKEIEFCGVRGLDGIKEARIQLVDDRELKIAVVNGLKNAETLLEKMKLGEVHYDFVEFMACRGGCLGGAGQPFSIDDGIRQKRALGIYNVDKISHVKRSEENPMIVSLYSGILKGKVHSLLHTDHNENYKLALENERNEDHIEDSVN